MQVGLHNTAKHLYIFLFGQLRLYAKHAIFRYTQILFP